MICEKCGKTIHHLVINVFNHEGIDSPVKVTIDETDYGSVMFRTNRNWVGYELSEEEMNEDIRCPMCGKNPFTDESIEIDEPVYVFKFKSGVKGNDNI